GRLEASSQPLGAPSIGRAFRPPYPPYMRRLRMRRSTILRWAAAVGWTVLVVALTLLPGSSRVVHDTSAWFGGTELTDAIGHFLLFLVLAVAWQGALASWLERSRALL